jgi:sugar phosphate permease
LNTLNTLNSDLDTPKAPGIYRGWWVALGAFVAAMFATVAHTSFGLFVAPVSQELGLSRTQVNNWLIAMGIASAVLGPFTGRLVDRVSVRLVMAVGGVILALCLTAMSVTASPVLLILLAVPMAFASDSAGSIAANTVTARWFRRRRGRALALVGISASASGFVLAPLVAYLIATHGWRNTLDVLGIGGGTFIVVMALLLIRSRPSARQLGTFEEKGQSAQQHGAEQKLWRYRELLSNRNFLFLALGSGLLFASDRALLTAAGAYLADTGISLQKAGFLISTLMGSSIVGKLVVGYVADLVDPRKIFVVVAALHVLLLSVFVMQPAYAVMMAVAAIVGIGIGGVLPVYQVLTASVFGSASYGTVIGTAVVFQQILMMAAFRFVGEVRDRTGSYTLAFETFIVIALLAPCFIWQLKTLRVCATKRQAIVIAAK